jgi:hypothetical protein
MSDDRSQTIEQLFSTANRELADEAFVARVMTRTSMLDARRLMAAFAVCLVAIPATWLAAGPFDDALLGVTQLLSQPIADIGDGLASSVVLPMNNIGGAVVLALIALRAIARRLFPGD